MSSASVPRSALAYSSFITSDFCARFYDEQAGSPGIKRVRIFLREMKVPEIAEHYMQNDRFRLDTGVLNGIHWLRGWMPDPGSAGAIPEPPECVVWDMIEGEVLLVFGILLVLRFLNIAEQSRHSHNL
jgi:hypothetical protein